ncbi:D-amino-acid dehydrogenase/Ca-activated chloride channel family protein [Seinonella peptonophila]|uniref:D-amino-acid dehydrogenase/Ca-activated chloride channel family protein n=1 Tax=Seinonella peptonophila TaxID=112248 RepID=A0A1M4ZI49_9BACL|nr:VWA domain-containing protein [Seinonella peptonophila]SHF17713.1 D-amino-acid dehydrogenase/Ca-activated chloride channel family protein [Seinonella peptonophila]
MKRFVLKFALILTSLLLIITGCESKTQSKTSIPSQAGKPISSVSTGSYGEWEKKFLRNPGVLSGTKFDEKKVKELAQQAPSNGDAAKYVDFIMSLVAEDYRPIIQKFNQLGTNINVNQDGQPGKLTLPENKKVHVSILLDASGSMNKKIGGKTKMGIAKGAVKKFAASLPTNAEISLRVYGHKGSENGASKEESCNSTEEIYKSTGYNESEFAAALDKMNPAGWTPIGKALESVSQDIKADTTDSYVYVVSDGEETCGGDPVGAAKKLKESSIKTVVNIIGFDVEDKGQKSLQDVAYAGGGQFIAVNDETALNKYIDEQYQKLRDEWRSWIGKGKGQAEEQSDQIHGQARQMEQEMDELRKTEFKHVKQVMAGLKGHVDQSVLKTAFEALNERRNEIGKYANQRSQDKYSESWKNKVKEKGDITDQGNKNIQDMDKK